MKNSNKLKGSLAIMQPYFLPYIGYFQLISAVEKFVFYQDVNFIKQGWINRNNILIQNKASLFSVPLENASSFSLIQEVKLHEKQFPLWRNKFLKTLEMNYKKAPFFEDVFALLRSFLEFDGLTISELAQQSTVSICRYLSIDTIFVENSSVYNNADLKASKRVQDICFKEKANVYINPIGGQELYNKTDFKNQSIDLFFIKSQPIEYKQFSNLFVPWLSIIDVMMFNSVDKIKEFLNNYQLV